MEGSWVMEGGEVLGHGGGGVLGHGGGGVLGHGVLACERPLAGREITKS